MRGTAAVLLAFLAAVSALPARAVEPVDSSRPRHHVEPGFFDVHVCHWSDRPLFFLALFATTRFEEIRAIDVLDPAGKPVGALDLSQYRLVLAPGKKEKRVFIRQFPVPANAGDGWYSARITGRDGRQWVARDFVVLAEVAYVASGQPAPEAEDIPIPSELKWEPVAGVKHYQVFLHDLWDGEKLIYTSALLDQPHVSLPRGLLKPGGYYAWRVHARDVNEHVLLGDFNHGSLGPQMRFSVAP